MVFIFEKSVYAESAEISTVTGFINGSFHVTNSLSLATMAAPIDVHVDLRNEHDDFSILKISNNDAYVTLSFSNRFLKIHYVDLSTRQSASRMPNGEEVNFLYLLQTLGVHSI